MTSQTSADSSSDNHAASDPRPLWPSTPKRYCGILEIIIHSAHVSLPSDENTRDSLGLLQKDSEWKVYAVVGCGMHQISSAASYWRHQPPKWRGRLQKPGADDEDTLVLWERPEARLHYWACEDSPTITAHIIAQNFGTEMTVLLCSFRTEPEQLGAQVSLQVDSHHGQGSLSLELFFSSQGSLNLSNLNGKHSPGQVVYIRHEERPRYALVAVRSTAESPLRSDLLDATHGAAPFISPVTSVYQAERTLFYLLTVIPGGGNLFVHLQRE
ncbi:hypothetical protein BBAD15_g10412 [Beauveria bassiana D1-5]|uniref:Uncharacterized protein n=1 Tax=Beauveria bassiana D1-5 TaxID=1245745 RepID=A0A0A2VA12_BEABA|nr:hypothetical protein BBAD15_g10412 [Beauveria bassiana D1-5]